MTPLNFGRDVQGFNAYAPKISDIKYSATLAASTHSTITVPSSAEKWIAVFSYEAVTNVWVAVNGTAAVPAGGTFATTTSQLNPPALTVYAADVIDIITANATTDVGVAFYTTT